MLPFSKELIICFYCLHMTNINPVSLDSWLKQESTLLIFLIWLSFLTLFIIFIVLYLMCRKPDTFARYSTSKSTGLENGNRQSFQVGQDKEQMDYYSDKIIDEYTTRGSNPKLNGAANNNNNGYLEVF